MSLTERIKLYSQIEKERGRPLITYVTSARPGLPALPLMAVDVIPELLDQLPLIPAKEKRIDFLIVSYGGDPTVAWRIMSLLRERFSHVSVLAPQTAYSAATLLALGADEIVMHPHANLGPVDPQFTINRPGQGQIRFGSEEVQGYFEFAKNTAGIKDQQQLQAVFDRLVNEVGPIGLGAVARGQRLLSFLGKQLLQMHMTGKGDERKAEKIAETLGRNFAHHGYPLSRREAREIGLKIAADNPSLEEKMWSAWLMIEQDLQVRQPHNPYQLVAASKEGSKVFTTVPGAGQPNFEAPPIDYDLTLAILESARKASRARLEGKLLAARLPLGTPTGLFQVTDINISSGWTSVPFPKVSRV